jgi:hypothetical protein
MEESTKPDSVLQTIKAIQLLQKNMCELVSQIGGETNKFFSRDPASYSQADLALYLALLRTDTTRGTPFEMITEEPVNIILESIALPVFQESSEIFACGLNVPGFSAYGNPISWAVLFKSKGPPKLTFDKGNIGLTFPECDYRVYCITKDEGDFHLTHGCPTIELHTSPDSFDLPRPWRKVAKSGPFPAAVLLDEILTAKPLKYSGLGSIVCDDMTDRFIATPQGVRGNEGYHIVNRIRECLPEA